MDDKEKDLAILALNIQINDLRRLAAYRALDESERKAYANEIFALKDGLRGWQAEYEKAKKALTKAGDELLEMDNTISKLEDKLDHEKDEYYQLAEMFDQVKKELHLLKKELED